MTNDDKEMLANAILITCAICLAIVAATMANQEDKQISNFGDS